MPELATAARARLLAVTAAASTVLLVAVAVGWVLLGTGPTDAVATSGGVGAADPRAGSTDLPLRIPEPAVTLTSRPRPTPSPTSNRTSGPRADRAGRPAAAGRTAAGQGMPSAAERDRELAALVTRATPTTGTTGTTGATGATGTAESTPPGSTAGSSPAAADGPGADFVLATFNVLGASHTRHGGRGRASGVVRIRGAAELLSRHDVDVAGFQELQHEQARALLQVTNRAYALYPGPGARDSDNSIGWRTSKFELVRATSMSIPYFNGHHRSMPVVLLRDRASGVEAWFANVHNPAETHTYHHQQRWRTRATYIESALANRIAPTGVPLFLTGDMNERAEYFCRLTAAAPSMVAAHPGSNRDGGCQAGHPRAVDWIFGTRGVVFSGYDEDRSDLVDVTTDHPVVTTRVHVDPAVFPRAVR
jgi:endonuclease/exonuclease/phosphatase family protein